MNDEEKDYFIPEQLDDNDFEKEKLEEKQHRKENGTLINKTKIKNIILILLIIALIAFGVYWYITPHEKKASAPEQSAKDFCSYFNNGEWDKLNKLLDFKGYYALSFILEDETEYTKFDSVYNDVEELGTNYDQFMEEVNLLTSIDKESLDNLADIEINLNNIQSCNKIQGTNTLYRLIVDFDYVINGEDQKMTGVLFITNASGEYKMVYGEWMQEVLNYYQSAYMIKNGYSY